MPTEVEYYTPIDVESDTEFETKPDEPLESENLQTSEPQNFEAEETLPEPEENTSSDAAEIENVPVDEPQSEIEEVLETPENVQVEDSESFKEEETEIDSHDETPTPNAEIKDEPFEEITTPNAEINDTSFDEMPMKPEVSATNNFSTMDFDDGDLLELPSLVEETGIRPQTEIQNFVEPSVQPTVELVHEPESKITLTKTVAESEIAVSFPPELIEAIAQKVAEKISAKTLNDVLPQLADLVVKKLAEQRKE